MKETVKTMDFTGWTNFEEGEDHKFGQKGDGHSFLGCMRCNLYRLPSVQTINDDYYAGLLDCFNNILKKKRSHLAKKKVLFTYGRHR